MVQEFGGGFGSEAAGRHPQAMIIETSPSLWKFVFSFWGLVRLVLLGVLIPVVGIFIGVGVRAIWILNTNYELYPDRLLVKRGARTSRTVDLYRITDLRLKGEGTIVVFTDQRTQSKFRLLNVKDIGFYDRLCQLVKVERRRRVG